jgi:hypothetical protein
MTPTIGRQVWFHPAASDPILALPDRRFDASPMAATVAYVFPDGAVNLVVTDHSGRQSVVERVVLHQGDIAATDCVAPATAFCHWPSAVLKKDAAVSALVAAESAE